MKQGRNRASHQIHHHDCDLSAFVLPVAAGSTGLRGGTNLQCHCFQMSQLPSTINFRRSAAEFWSPHTNLHILQRPGVLYIAVKMQTVSAFHTALDMCEPLLSLHGSYAVSHPATLCVHLCSQPLLCLLMLWELIFPWFCLRKSQLHGSISQHTFHHWQCLILSW